MAKVKLGRLNVADYVVEKPVGIRGNGALVFPKELISKAAPPFFGLSMMPQERKAALAIERLKLEPNLEFGIMNRVGRYTKAEIIQHIEQQTSLGREFTDIEVNYAEYFTQQILGKATLEPKVTAAARIKAPIVSGDWVAVPKTKWQLFKSRVLF